jgi:hypothetical protein
MTGLLGSTVLEVAIGMALLYLLMAIFCTVTNEWIAGVLNTRATMLAQGLKQMLDCQPAPVPAQNTNPITMIQKFYSHPLITGLMHKGKHPSYMPARSFASVVIDLVTPQHPGSITFEQLENGINALPEGDVKRTLLALIQNANHDLDQAQKAIEGWFNDTMDRVSGWYKRRTQLWIFLLAAVITVGLNADTLQAARKLWIEPTLRSTVVENARSQAASPPAGANAVANAQPAASGRTVTDTQLGQLGQLVGWQAVVDWSALAWLERLVGWVLTICAVSLGAPFWFDTLNRIVNIRAAGKNPGGK